MCITLIVGIGVCVFTIGVDAFFCCCLVGYLCITCASAYYGLFSTSFRLPLFLFVQCCSDTLGMKLNISARFPSAVCCVSFIVAKGAFVVGCFNAST